MKTECPHCHTIFKLSQQQLELADGMVRCGMCQRVFNARVQPDLFNTTQTAGTDEANDSHSRDDNQPDAASPRNATTDASQDDAALLFETSASDSLVPDSLRQGGTQHSLATTMLYTLGTIVLSTTLLLQFAWFYRDSLLRQPQLHTYVAQLCQHIECDRLQLRDPARIELSQRNVYTHPTESNALMVSLTLVNRAPFSQDFPDIQIEFSDVAGNVVAARRLRPEEYLNADTDNPRALLPDAPVSLALEIVDPGKQALTYEFRFL